MDDQLPPSTVSPRNRFSGQALAGIGDSLSGVAVPSPVLIAGHAQWLLAESDPGDWSIPAVRRLAAARGWETVPPGEAWGVHPLPVEEHQERYCGDRGCRELALPAAEVPEPERTAASLAAAFAGVGSALAQALGPPTSLGSHGLVGPWDEAAPSWGSPFLWRRPGDRTLELRATEGGADLVMYPTGPFESWRKDHHEWSDRPGGGFIITRSVPGNDGPYLPGAPRARTWRQLQSMMSAFLSRLPAETAALTVSLSITIYAGTVGSLRADKIKSPARLNVTFSGGDYYAVLLGLGLGPDLFYPVTQPRFVSSARR